jgi:hypothetical protein
MMGDVNEGTGDIGAAGMRDEVTVGLQQSG